MHLTMASSAPEYTDREIDSDRYSKGITEGVLKTKQALNILGQNAKLKTLELANSFKDRASFSVLLTIV